jgi:uncharacterized protein YceH (UPF0502 family)
MNDELREMFETMRREMAQIGANSERMAAEARAHSDRNAAETRRHFDVVAERLESKIETIAEGVVAANERIDRLDAKVDRLAADMDDGFNETRSMIKFSHHELDRRLRSLEDVVADLQARVERLESSTQ